MTAENSIITTNKDESNTIGNKLMSDDDTTDVVNSDDSNTSNEDTNKENNSSTGGFAMVVTPSTSDSVVDEHGGEDKGGGGGGEEGDGRGSVVRLPEDSKASSIIVASEAAAGVSSSSSIDHDSDSNNNNNDDDDEGAGRTSRPTSSNARPFLHDPSPASSYLHKTHQITEHTIHRRISARAVDMHVLDDVQDLKWKLYGKNIYFSIVFDAVIKIQAFVRGCLCRGKVADHIDDIIQQLVKRREERVQDEKIREQYRQQDLVDREQRRINNNNNNSDVEADRRVTENVYKPWKKDQSLPSPDEEELSPFEELLLARNKTILKREEEQEGASTSKFAVINAHSDTVGTEHSTVEIIDIEMSLKQRLKIWTTSNNHIINYNKRDNDEKKTDSEQVKHEKKVFSEEHEDHAEGDSEKDDQSNHLKVHGSSCDDSSSIDTDHPEMKSETASSFSVSGNQSVTSSIDTEVRNNFASNRQHDLMNDSAEKRTTNSTMGTVPRRKKQWVTDVRSQSQGRSQKATPENYDECINLDPITMLPTFLEDEVLENTTPTIIDPGEKGYSRYREGAKRRNKQRPWRDDTDVFDAY